MSTNYGIPKKHVKTIAITSGKGGVGKTNITASLAIAMQKLGKKVLVMDADLGLSNIDILLGLTPQYNIKHLLDGSRTLREVVVEGPCGIKVLPAGGGIQELTRIDEFQRLQLIEAFDAYDSDIDVLLIDTGAGISSNVTFFCAAVEEVVVITSQEHTALADAYGLIKVLYSEYQENKFNVLINSVKDKSEADEVFSRLTRATERFLSLSLDYLGYLPYDEAVKRSVLAQRAFVEMYPRNFISKCILELAANLLEREPRITGRIQVGLGNLWASRAGEPG